MEIAACIHDVKRIEVAPVKEGDTCIWRRIKFVTDTGDYTMTAFPAGGVRKKLAIKFVKGE